MEYDNLTHCREVYIRHDISNDSRVVVVLALITVILAVLIVTTNLGFMAIMCRYRRKCCSKDQNKSQLIMMSLAACDAAIGIVLLPLFIYTVSQNGDWILNGKICLVYLMMDKVLTAVSIYHVTLMALDRYLATCTPVFYLKLYTRTIYLLILASWTLPIVSTVVSLVWGLTFNNHYHDLQCRLNNHVCSEYFSGVPLLIEILLDFWLPLITIYTLYGLIARQIYMLSQQQFLPNLSKNQTSEATNEELFNPNIIPKEDGDPEKELKDTKSSHVSMNSSEVDGVTLIEGKTEKASEEANQRQSLSKTSDSADVRMAPRLRRNSLKAYTTMGCIVLTFTICWLPFNIVQLVVHYFQFDLSPMIEFWFTFLSFANSAMNPICFCFTFSVRQALADALGCTKV